jgi:hypothetical protein
MARPTIKAVIMTVERFIETRLGSQRSQWPLLPSTFQAFEWMSRIKFFALAAVHKAVMRTNRRANAAFSAPLFAATGNDSG